MRYEFSAGLYKLIEQVGVLLSRQDVDGHGGFEPTLSQGIQQTENAYPMPILTGGDPRNIRKIPT